MKKPVVLGIVVIAIIIASFLFYYFRVFKKKGTTAKSTAPVQAVSPVVSAASATEGANAINTASQQGSGLTGQVIEGGLLSAAVVTALNTPITTQQPAPTQQVATIAQVTAPTVTVAAPNQVTAPVLADFTDSQGNTFYVNKNQPHEYGYHLYVNGGQNGAAITVHKGSTGLAYAWNGWSYYKYTTSWIDIKYSEYYQAVDKALGAIDAGADAQGNRFFLTSHESRAYPSAGRQIIVNDGMNGASVTLFVRNGVAYAKNAPGQTYKYAGSWVGISPQEYDQANQQINLLQQPTLSTTQFSSLRTQIFGLR